MKHKGFTLIELLIVIAIIAILALIAVPNFLEAQTRAKITQTLANMRTATVALEAYMVDWMAYPTGYRTLKQIRFDKNANFLDQPVDFIGTTFPLSTPVAYIGSGQSLTDPFSKFHHSTFNENGGGGDLDMADVGSLMYQRMGSDILASTPSGAAATALDGRRAYVLFSFGPDMKLNNNVTFKELDPASALRDMFTVQNAGQVTPFRLNLSLYDPTNGTSSKGDMFVFGGEAANMAQRQHSFGQ